jgi:type VI secretion system protein ImpG
VKFIEYYEKELRYFLDEAQRFSLAYPVQARALNLEDVRERDPYVERLIEAFAFLSGNIRKRIDDDFSDVARDLLCIIWPHYLYPLPASVILEAKPIPGRTIPADPVPAGAMVESGPVSTDLPCRFTTSGPIPVRPFFLKEAGMVSRTDGRSAVRLRLSIENMNVRWNEIQRFPIRLYLHGDPGFTLNLYYLLTTDTAEIALQWTENAENRRVAGIPPEKLRPAAFVPDTDAALLPYPEHSFPGFRLLEEYFFFHDKFLFLELDVLEDLGEPDGDSDLLIDLVMTGEENWNITPATTNFRLHCTPAINLFPASAEPIHLDDSRQYNKIIVDHAVSGHYVPHHISRVEGISLNKGERRTYPSFFSYRHETGKNDVVGYHHTKVRHGVDGIPEILLSIFRRENSGPEIISADIMCSNDHVVREVRPRDITRPFSNIPDYVTIQNLTRPSTPAWPRLEGREMWSLIHCLALNYESLDNPYRVRDMLRAYDREGTRANRRRIDGVEDVQVKPTEKLVRGFPVRGIDMRMTLDESKFTNRGDVKLFADIFSRVMSMYVPINSFCHLHVTEKHSGREHFGWPDIEITGKKAMV